MKATNSLEGLGILIVFVVSISIGFIQLLFRKFTTTILLPQIFKHLKIWLFELVYIGDNVVNRGAKYRKSGKISRKLCIYY